MYLYKRVLLLFFFFILFSSTCFAQDIKSSDYQKIFQTPDLNERIFLLDKFRKDYPSSNYFNHSLSQTFSAFVQMGNSDSALVYASKYLNMIPEASRETAYNNLAYQLAQKQIALDSAESFINKAVSLARANKSRRLNVILNTQAMVLFNLGNAQRAAEIQKEAIVGNEKNPDYLMNFAQYLHSSGDKVSAFESISKSILFGGSLRSIEFFDTWLAEEYPDVKNRTSQKEKIIGKAISNYFTEDDSPEAKSTAAACLAVLKINLDTAEKYANEAVSTINDKTPVEEILYYKQNLAEVKFANNNYESALNELASVEKFAGPWEFDYWYLLGSVYEALSQKEKALDAYLIGMIFPGNDKITAAVDRHLKEKNLDKNFVDKKIEELKNEMKAFELEKPSNKIDTEKVVVAELFTGAECPPCVAADNAFDKLAEAYSREELIILEYHLHIPGPDPMTNPDAFLKYRSYGGNYGTPTVFIDGTDLIGGGGPDFVTKNRASIYQYTIERISKEKPAAVINGSAVIDGENVSVKLDIEKAGAELNNAKIQIALLEKSVDYTGVNGVSKHIYVVRDLVNGSDGIPFNSAAEKQSINEIINMRLVEEGLKKYLDDPTSDPSWRIGTKFSGWRARTDKINRNNLSVAVYIQNNDTRKILQAKYFDLSPGK